jgi:hypothetical protein
MSEIKIYEGKVCLAHDGDGSHTVYYGEVDIDREHEDDDFIFLTHELRTKYMGKKVRLTIEVIEQ